MASTAQSSTSFKAGFGEADHAVVLPVPALIPVVFAAQPNAPAAPTVRIFLGTEPAQYRAERVFFYSLAKVRNPQRRYEVYRMTGLAGFDSAQWRTNFTNYRFAIPDLAGRTGKAIYTDVDQIFTADPAQLFDTPMGQHGYLALSPHDTAVMLIDCERMSQCWSFASAVQLKKKHLLALADAELGRWGQLEPAWHARDMEYRHGESKLLHYTTLHLQPWRPTPDQYCYQIHPFAEYFLALEQAADTEGYEIYSAAQPSPAFSTACAQADLPSASQPLAAELTPETARLLRTLSCEHLGMLGVWQMAALPELPRTVWTFTELAEDNSPAADAILVCDLEKLPAEDLPWLVERIFKRAHKFVLLRTRLTSEGTAASSSGGWRALVRRIARHYPDCCWQLECVEANGHIQRFLADFPRRQQVGQLPLVWVLLGQHSGDNAQLLAIAHALGWSYECKSTDFKPSRFLPEVLLASRLSRATAGLTAPWPDLVLCVGWRTAPVAQWIKRQSAGKAQIVAIGRPRADLARFDLLLTTPQYNLPLCDNMVDLPVPYVVPPTCAENNLQTWQARFAALPRPWLGLLVGGSRVPYVLDAKVARQLGQQANAAARAQGGSLLIATSPRTSSEAVTALLAALEVPYQFYPFSPEPSENPYPALLALADGFIVTGESVSMLTEARLMDRPMAFFPLPIVRKLKGRLRHAVEVRLGMVERAIGSRGTPRQQTKLERLYHRGIAKGFIKRGREVEQIHRVLGLNTLEEGLAPPAGLPLALLEAARRRVITAVRDLLVAERQQP